MRGACAIAPASLTFLQPQLDTTAVHAPLYNHAPRRHDSTMSIFASKSAFVALGLEVVAPSNAHMYQDCFICKDPLDINIHTPATKTHHSAVRIGVCGHMHGRECLMAWLDAGNSCPTCKRVLFENSGREISQSDIRNVVHSLRYVVGEKRVMKAIARLVGRQEVEQAQLRVAYEDEQKKAKAKEAREYHEDVIGDDEWMDSGDEEGLEGSVDGDENGGSDFDMTDDAATMLDEGFEPQLT